MKKEYYDEFGIAREISDEEIQQLNQREKVFHRRIRIIIVIGILIYYFHFHFFVKHYEYVDSFHEIAAPMQTATSGETDIEIDGIVAHLTFLAEYKVSGTVMSKYNYFDYEFTNKLSPTDVGIAWGYLADEWKNAKWESSPSRFLRYTTKKGDWYSSRGGYQGIGKYFSNNHLIPADATIEKQIKHIRKNDYVSIEGYLVNGSWNDTRGRYTWNSSTVRDDTGAGACEIIYVTKVSWLKEK